MKKQNTFSTGMAAVLWSSLILLLLFLDQFTKHEAFLHLRHQDSIPLIPGVLELSYQYYMHGFPDPLPKYPNERNDLAGF